MHIIGSSMDRNHVHDWPETNPELEHTEKSIDTKAYQRYLKFGFLEEMRMLLELNPELFLDLDGIVIEGRGAVLPTLFLQSWIKQTRGKEIPSIFMHTSRPIERSKQDQVIRSTIEFNKNRYKRFLWLINQIREKPNFAILTEGYGSGCSLYNITQAIKYLKGEEGNPYIMSISTRPKLDDKRKSYLDGIYENYNVFTGWRSTADQFVLGNLDREGFSGYKSIKFPLIGFDSLRSDNYLYLNACQSMQDLAEEEGRRFRL
jgi:hypothetical protein